MSRKLLIWKPHDGDPNTGEITGSQEGAITESVIGCYEAQGERAAFFDIPSLDWGNRFIHRGKIRERPKMMARIDKTRIRADGQDVAKIIGVPCGAVVRMTDGLSQIEERADGKTIEITAPIPSRWVIDIEAFAHQSQRFEIIAE